MSFANKVFVVTGGNSGMGYDAAKYLTSEGAKVYITGRNQDAVDKAALELGKNVVGVLADTASISDSVKLAEIIATNGDKLDGLFANAGVAPIVPFEHVDEAHFDLIFNINAKGTYFTVQKLLPVLRDGASIVLNGSTVVHQGFPGCSVYAASKAAVNSFAKTLSRDLLPRKIRVNVVNPGSITTPISTKLGLPQEVLDSFEEIVKVQVPAGRSGRVDEITGYVAFLLSDKSTYVLGTELTIDGGHSQI